MKTTLSKRLLAVTGFVTPGSRVADIGTDHAFVPIYLIEHKIVPSALAMDIGKGPLLAAEEHIKEHGLEKYITARQSDGVLALQDGEADSVIIAGMGGALVMKILSEGRERLQNVKELILQPQSEVEKVRHFLYESGYHITAEEMIFEDGKYYPMMHVVPGRDDTVYPESYFKYGGWLIREKNEVLLRYLEKEEREVREIRKKLLPGQEKERIRARLDEIEERLAVIEQAKMEMHGS